MTDQIPNQANDAMELSGRCEQMLADGMSQMRELGHMWQDALDMFGGNQWAKVPIRDGWDQVVMNMVFPAIMQNQAIKRQRQITISAKPWDPDYASESGILQNHLQWLYSDQLNMPELLDKWSLDGELYGHYIASTVWEPNLRWDDRQNRWIGGPQVRVVLPEYFGADPEAESIEDAQYCFFRRSVGKQWAMNRWKQFAEIIEAAPPHDARWISGGLQYTTENYAPSDDTAEISYQTRLSRFIRRGDRQRRIHGQVSLNDKKGGRVDVEQFFVRDPEEQKFIRERKHKQSVLIEQGKAYMDGTILRSADNNEPITTNNWPGEAINDVRPLYPKGRFIIRVNGYILNPDPQEQRWPFDNWPFVVGVNQILPHTWCGLNGVEQTIGNQRWLNVTASHITNYLKNFGDPKIIVEDGALTAQQEEFGITNGPGRIWHVKMGKLNGVRVEYPTGTPEGLMRCFDMIAQQIRSATGIHEISEGRDTGGKITATEAVNNAANTKLRTSMSLGMRDAFTCKVMQNVAELVQKMSEPQDMLRIAGKSQTKTVVAMTARMKAVQYDLSLKVQTDLPLDIDKEKADAEAMLKIFGMTPTVVDRLAHAYRVDDIDAFKQEVQDFQQFQQWKAQQELLAQQAGQAGAAPSAQPTAKAPPEPAQPAVNSPSGMRPVELAQ